LRMIGGHDARPSRADGGRPSKARHDAEALRENSSLVRVQPGVLRMIGGHDARPSRADGGRPKDSPANGTSATVFRLMSDS
jgi:hypothetical protein